MNELTPLETLSNIEGATTSEAVENLFNTLRDVKMDLNGNELASLLSGNAVTTDDLREDVVIEASETEKRLIIANFPSQKDNYLVVPKVIEE